MVEKVKKYVESELANIKRGYDPNLALTRSYGALMFVLSDEWNEDLAKWWDNYAHPRFRKEIANVKSK